MEADATIKVEDDLAAKLKAIEDEKIKKEEAAAADKQK